LANSFAPAQNSFSSKAVNPGIGRSITEGHASLGQPPIRLQSMTGRTPGSRAGDCAKPRDIAVLKTEQAKTELMNHLGTTKLTVRLLIFDWVSIAAAE